MCCDGGTNRLHDSLSAKERYRLGDEHPLSWPWPRDEMGTPPPPPPPPPPLSWPWCAHWNALSCLIWSYFWLLTKLCKSDVILFAMRYCTVQIMLILAYMHDCMYIYSCSYTPQFICGDLDSARPEVLDFYQKKVSLIWNLDCAR